MTRAPRPRAVPEGGFREIAVLRLSSLGDVILTLPAVRTLAAAYPRARITYWTKEEYADVPRLEPAIAHVRVLEKDARRIEDLVSMSAELERCDLIVDLHRSLRTRLLTFRQKASILRPPSFRLRRARWVHARWSRPAPAPHALERYARALAPIGLEASGTPAIAPDAASVKWADAWFEKWPAEGPIVALCPASVHPTKRWPEEHWQALDDRLAIAGARRLYFSLARERAEMPALGGQIEGAMGARWCSEPLPRMVALMGRCASAVTNDTGLMHLAAACGLPVVAMFGSTAPELGFAPAGEGHAVLCRHEPCQPCTIHGRTRCPKGHFRCMKEMAPAEVAGHAVALAGL